MDPIAHTLAGAVLAETGLKRVSRYATTTLLIGVNLPDIDGIAKFRGPDASLYVRRGWSHGILALVVLPLLLAGLLVCGCSIVKLACAEHRTRQYLDSIGLALVVILRIKRTASNSATLILLISLALDSLHGRIKQGSQ